jgi:Uma2 family endonuclease
MSSVQVRTVAERPQRLTLDDVDWGTYTRVLRALDERRLRITYDQGTLEIMTITHEHESDSRFLGRLAITLTEELNLPIKGGGTTTFRRRQKERGLEPDDCYWIASEPSVRGKRKIDLRGDPPPDLAIEVDVTHSSLDRMAIYASLAIPEVWRYDGKVLTFNELQPDGSYAVIAHSKAFPIICPTDLMKFLPLRQRMDENAVINWTAPLFLTL